MNYIDALQLIAAPQRPDGTWDRDREACRQLAAEALGFHNGAALPAVEPVAWMRRGTKPEHGSLHNVTLTEPDEDAAHNWTPLYAGAAPTPTAPAPSAQANRQAILDSSAAEPVATLHDDGCFTWKRDGFRLKYDRQRAGWRMDVYATPQEAPAVPADPTDPGFDVPVLREHVRHLERRVRQLAATPKEAPAPLTDAEIDVLWRAPMSADWEHREFARAIERAHGITAPTAPTGGEG